MKKVMKVVAVAMVILFPLTMLSGCAKRCCETPCDMKPRCLEKCKTEYGCK